MRDLIQRLTTNIETVFTGKADVVRSLLVGLFAGGHILIEDVPGVGKTTLARALAKSIECSFRRIQFTPDLLPSDILGVSVYNAGTGEFVFKPGPIFAGVVLADEINRTTPRTQSSLLEAMNDGQVSADGTTHLLPRPFIVLATQNPFEYEGTYPLPESQLDRFFMKISIGYPAVEDEKLLLDGRRGADMLESLQPVASPAEVLAVQAKVREVKVEASLVDYAMNIVRSTREHPDIAVGASPRGFMAFVRGAQALAFLDGRDYCLPDDIKSLAVPILSHRLIGRNKYDNVNANAAILGDIVKATPVPV